MRQIIRWVFIWGLLASSSAFSTNPVEGFYLGLFGEVSHATNTQINPFILGSSYFAPVKLGQVGGGTGLSVGYKLNNFRVETEFLFNMNNYGEFSLPGCTLLSPSVLGPRGACFGVLDNPLNNYGIGFNGNIMGFYGLVNGYYDFRFSDEINVIPYIGVGIGGALLRNFSSFKSNNQHVALGLQPVLLQPIDFTTTSNGLAGQGVLGLYSYLDDVTTLGIDFRYLSTFSANSSASNSTGNFGITSMNIVLNFALERGNSPG